VFVAKKKRSNSASLPAPIGGWNARDSLADMATTDAVMIENWFPSTSEVILRNGYVSHATGLPSQVETVMSYNAGTTKNLFAISDGEVYDVTAGGAVGAAVLTGLTNSRWQYINVSTTGGNYLYMANGLDAPRTWDGTVWATPSITGVTTTLLTNPNLHQNRVWFIQKGTLHAWYLPSGAIAGTANMLDMSSVAQYGGYLVAMATWTIDAGYGVDDLAVFMTSEGEVIVYKGTDPANASTWALVGIWRIGSPIGDRCWLKYAGDLLIISEDGVFPMSGALQSSRTNPKVAITDKIQRAVSESVTAYGENFGWQLLYYAKANQLWLNVPVQEFDNQQQYVMNTINKSWCQYTGWNANCWEIHEEEPYFGGNGIVGKAWSGNSDDGNNIVADCLQAYNYAGAKGVLKRWTMARPILRSNGQPSVNININVDFDDTNNTAPISTTPTSYATWDSAIWDGSVWGGGMSIIKNWQGINGIGYCAGPRVNLVSNGIEVSWVATDFVYETGDVL
jgi:hypothetical protein